MWQRAVLLCVWASALGGCDRNTADRQAPPQEKAKGVPTQLFGVELGKAYGVPGSDFTKSALPIGRFTGAQQVLGHGTHVYFQPAKPYTAFPYIEERKSGEQFFTTSYRLYVLPVVPKDAKTVADFNDAKATDYEVLLIEWREPNEDRPDTKKNEDYAWAADMCKTFEADLALKPKVIEQWVPPGDKATVLGSAYSCTFTEADRELEVSSLFGRTVKLSLTNAAMKAKADGFELAVRKLVAPAIRPY